MGQPTITDLHTNVPLTTISIAYRQDQTQYIATEAFPVVPVQNRSNVYYIYDRDYWFRSEAKPRQEGTESAGSDYTLRTGTYQCEVYAHHKMVGDQTRANADSILAPDRDATELVTDQLMLLREQIFISKFFGPGIWTGTPDQTGVGVSPTTNQFLQWDNIGSNPIEYVQALMVAMAKVTAKRPDTLVLGPEVANVVRNHPEIVDRVKFTQTAFLDFNILAPAFGVKRVLVPWAVQNNAAQGEALNMNFMYGKNLALFYSEPNPGLLKASAAYIFAWQAYLNGSADIALARFRMQERKADRVEGEMAFDMRVIASDLGIFAQSVIA